MFLYQLSWYGDSDFSPSFQDGRQYKIKERSIVINMTIQTKMKMKNKVTSSLSEQEDLSN